MCAVSYLAVYVARNILSAVSPQMIEGGGFTNENIGTLSSIFFISYATGQLINGSVGDKIKAKWMVSMGLLFAGVCNLLFSLLSHSVIAAYICYAATGFFLSMIYGPITKVVAENTELLYATRCSLGFTFASFLGTPFAGVLGAAMDWKATFSVSSAMLAVTGVLCIVAFTAFEKKGLIEYNKYKKEKSSGAGVKVLLKHDIVKFTLISILTGVVRTTVVFWLPTYISQYLGFSTKNASVAFTVSTFVISMTSFIAIFVYERLNRNMSLTILLAFISSMLCFLLVFFVKIPIVNIVFLVLAIMSSNSAATMLWSRYCPSLRDTGMVSGATGFLDFMSYMAAAASSTLFANAVSDIGWGNLILVWAGLMALGVVVALPYRRFIKKNINEE
ncbi:MAG: MFS transporter [Oscillospiraceae bacterium]|nr:MFS transporter [Oscillospiraceae bacterium]